MEDTNRAKRNFTIGEAVDMLMQDEDLEFGSGSLELYVHDAYGVVVLDIYTHQLSTLNSDYAKRVWHIIPQPISFMKASQSGSKIKVKHKLVDTKIFSGYYNLRYLMEKLSDNYSTSQIREILCTGEFYLK